MSAVAIHPFTGQILAGCDDATVRVIDPVTRSITQTLVGHQAELTNICTTAAPYIVSGAEDSQVCVWDAKTLELVDTISMGPHNRVWCVATVPS